jgi:glycosyltransferase involved in cell wall biosynthesis
MKKVGIFLGYNPEQTLKNQGISRLLGFLLSGALNSTSIKVVLATPGWSRKDLAELLNDLRIKESEIEIISTNGQLNLLRLRRWGKGLKERKFLNLWNIFKAFFIKETDKPKKSWKSKIANFIAFFLSDTFLLKMLVFLILIVFLAILIGPFVLLYRIIKPIRTRLRKFLRFAFNILIAPSGIIKQIGITNAVWQVIRAKEMERLIKIINKHIDIDAWFIPCAFWPEIVEIKKRKVVCVPDIVFLEFPIKYANFYSEIVFNNMKQVIYSADSLITYSLHVKENHLEKGLSVDPKKITVINHGYVDLSIYLKDKFKDKGNIPMRHRALEIMREFQQKKYGNDFFLRTIDFNHFNYIFYSSQIRGHKNFINLVKAYEILVKKYNKNLKLVVTADYEAESNILDYIQKKQLHYDILSFHSVPSEVLAALNHLAVCSVTPTLFEGGFPFTFNEAYSVGTPSVISAIPVVLELVKDEELRNVMLFDPTDPEDIAQKVAWAVDNRQKLFDMEKHLFEQFRSRSWEIVAEEYFNVILGTEKVS